MKNAINSGDLGRVLDILNSGVDVNFIYDGGMTALMFAAEGGHCNIVQMLLVMPGIEVNVKNDKRYTALALAVEMGHGEIALQMLSFPEVESEGFTELMCAAVGGDLLLTRHYLSLSVENVNARSDEGYTALILAAKRGHSAVVSLLLSVRGIAANIADSFEYTALMYAALEGYDCVVKHLVEVPGIDLNAQTDDGETAVTLALYSNHGSTVLCLLSAPGLESLGCTELMCAAMSGNVELVRRFLAAPDADVNAQNDYGFSALMFAATAGCADVVKVLLEVPGIDVNLEDGGGTTALMCAIQKVSVSTVRLLLSVPTIKVGLGDDISLSTIMNYLREECSRAIRYVLSVLPSGANLKDVFDKKVLLVAVESGSVAVVRLLVSRLRMSLDRFINPDLAEQCKAVLKYFMCSGRLLLGAGENVKNSQDAVATLNAMSADMAGNPKKTDYYNYVVGIKDFISSLSSAISGNIAPGLPNRINLLVARVYGIQFDEDITVKHTGLSKLKFIWVSSLMSVAKLTKFSHGFNSYMTMHMVMLRKSIGLFSRLADISKASILEFLVGTPWDIGICKLTSTHPLSPDGLASSSATVATAAAQQDSSQAAKHARHI